MVDFSFYSESYSYPTLISYKEDKIPGLNSNRGAEPSREERRRPRRSNSFSGVVGDFEGISRTTFKVLGENCEEEEANSVGEKAPDVTEVVPAALGASEGAGGPTLAHSSKPISYQSEPSLLALMQQMTQNMANLQASPSSEA
ncbi:hypothetical protein O181_046772 [Austropuccinia psidii MF-1]|uniref:Uncharacterized protein n=1 Tax=Austropuccinia psidii MF-1 TaxID=1389203 RepID=A0A9Q3HK06_9BASI|nr:hypothetical protein [Austropuccinia psidii MF-1]